MNTAMNSQKKTFLRHLEDLVVESVFQQITDLGRIPSTCCTTQEQQCVAIGPGNVQFMSIHQV